MHSTGALGPLPTPADLSFAPQQPQRFFGYEPPRCALHKTESSSAARLRVTAGGEHRKCRAAVARLPLSVTMVKQRSYLCENTSKWSSDPVCDSRAPSAPQRRAPRPAHPPRPYPRDERGELPAPPTPSFDHAAHDLTPRMRPASRLKRESKKAPDIGGLLAVVAMNFCSGPPMQFLSRVDTPWLPAAHARLQVAIASQKPPSLIPKGGTLRTQTHEIVRIPAIRPEPEVVWRVPQAGRIRRFRARQRDCCVRGKHRGNGTGLRGLHRAHPI
jgi:hypothetical protein